jgi:hypothetical protein
MGRPSGMDTKLTLWMDRNTIQRMKELSRRKGFGLSDIVEKFFRLLLESESGEGEPYTPLVRELSGVVRLEKAPDRKNRHANSRVGKRK